MLAATAADMDAELFFERPQAALQRAEHAGVDPGGVPAHAHDGPERREPERVGQPPQQLVAPIVMDDRLRDDRTKTCHALAKPAGHAAAVKRKGGAAGSSSHQSSLAAPYTSFSRTNRARNAS